MLWTKHLEDFILKLILKFIHHIKIFNKTNETIASYVILVLVIFGIKYENVHNQKSPKTL